MRLLKLHFLIIPFLASSSSSLSAQCADFCEDIEVVIPDCETKKDLDFLFHMIVEFGCQVIILDEDQNPVPNPIPNENRYLCKPLTVIVIDDDDVCSSELLIRMGEGPQVTPIPFESISAQNYNAGNVPRPMIEDCTQPIGPPNIPVLVWDYEDKFISVCNEIPKVERTWRVYDRCGNITVVKQTFDIISDLHCTLVGRSRIPIGVETFVGSKVTPGGLPPYIYDWSVIGDNWFIFSDKLNPTEARLLPLGPNPGNATVQLDLFDRLGCKHTCYKEVSSFVPRGNFLYGEGYTDVVLTVLDNSEVIIRSGDKIQSVRLLNLAGQILYRENGLSGPEFRIPIQQIPGGLYVLHMNTPDGPVSRKFLKK